MNHTQQPEPLDQVSREPGDALNLIDFLILFARQRKLLVALPLVVAVMAGLLSLLIPNSYKGSTRIMPPQQAQSGAAAFLSQLGGIASVAGASAKGPSDTYVAMLKSRTIAEKLVARFNLKSVYDREFDDATRRDLESNTVISSGKDGFILIEVEDEDRKRSADLANAYVEELQKLTRTLAVTEAAQRRLFFERELGQAKENLAKAEMTLKATLGTHGVISVDSESRAIMETVARLRAQIATKQIELGSMQAFVTADNPKYKRVAQELASMRLELNSLENGHPEVDDGGAAVKQAGLENIKVLRELKYQQMLYEQLATQFEIARLDEAKESSVIQVLDIAKIPERKFKPARVLIALGAGTLALFIAVIWILLADAKARVLRDPENARRMALLRATMGGKNMM